MTVAAEVRAPDKAMLGCSVAPFTGPGGLPQPCRFHNNSYANRMAGIAERPDVLSPSASVALLADLCPDN